MELHERHEQTARARIEMSDAIGATITKYHLSYGELFASLASVMSDWTKFLVREERMEQTFPENRVKVTQVQFAELTRIAALLSAGVISHGDYMERVTKACPELKPFHQNVLEVID